MNDVDFQMKVIGVGPQRTGTSWLYMCLREHPSLCFPRNTKETFFFDERFDKGWPWYFSHFRHRLANQLCIEIGPSYFDSPEALNRIKEHNPDCSIIVTLRDPADRSFSLYLHHSRKGRLNGEFREAVKEMPRIIHSSHYRIHLKRWLELFGKDRVLIILQDDIKSSPGDVLKKVYRFTGIAQVPLPSCMGEHINRASLPTHPLMAKFLKNGSDRLREKRFYRLIKFGKQLGLKRIYSGVKSLPVLEPELRKRLIEEFEPDIDYVEDLLKRPLPSWRSIKDAI